MKKIKCIKCGLYFKDRKDELDSEVEKTLCFNCRFIWKMLQITIQAIPHRANRDVQMSIDSIQIRKKK